MQYHAVQCFILVGCWVFFSHNNLTNEHSQTAPMVTRWIVWSYKQLCFASHAPFFRFVTFFFTTKIFHFSITSLILIAQSWLRYHCFEKKLNFETWKFDFDAKIASIEKSASKSSCVTFARGCIYYSQRKNIKVDEIHIWCLTVK